MDWIVSRWIELDCIELSVGGGCRQPRFRRLRFRRLEVMRRGRAVHDNSGLWRPGTRRGGAGVAEPGRTAVGSRRQSRCRCHRCPSSFAPRLGRQPRRRRLRHLAGSCAASSQSASSTPNRHSAWPMCSRWRPPSRACGRPQRYPPGGHACTSPIRSCSGSRLELIRAQCPLQRSTARWISC